MKILVLNGPNLNLLGTREPDIYGTTTLADIESNLRKLGQTLGVNIETYQSSHEGALIDALHRARQRNSAVIFNPGGYAHTSVALRDAISAINIPVIEVHISNIYDREDFRQTCITAAAADGIITGFGAMGYELALNALMIILKKGGSIAASSFPPARQVAQAGVAASAGPAGVAGQADREDRDDQEDRDGGRRRRRGRRGGRRRRGEELEDGEDRKETVERKAPHEDIDPEERYSGMEGVKVRRGLDVLADDNEDEVIPQGVVTFGSSDDLDDDDDLGETLGEASVVVVGPGAGGDEYEPDTEPEPKASSTGRKADSPDSDDDEPVVRRPLVSRRRTTTRKPGDAVKDEKADAPKGELNDEQDAGDDENPSDEKKPAKKGAKKKTAKKAAKKKTVTRKKTATKKKSS